MCKGGVSLCSSIYSPKQQKNNESLTRLSQELYNLFNRGFPETHCVLGIVLKTEMEVGTQRPSLYTHRSDSHKGEVVKPAKPQALENNENYQEWKPHLVEQLKPRTPATAKAGEAVGQQEPSFIAGGNAKRWQPRWKTVWQLLTKLNTLLPCAPEMTVLGVYPQELRMRIPTKPCTQYLTVLFTVAKTWR